MNTIPFIIENFLDFAVLFAGVWLIKSLFRNKMSAQLHFLIWGIAVLKLLIPFGLPSEASPWALMGAHAAPAAVQNNYEAYDPSAAEIGPAYENTASGSADNIVSGGQTLPAMNENSAAAPAPRTPVRVDWNIVIVSAWLSGIAARLAWLVLKSRRFRKKLLINEISPPLWVKECFDSCLKETCVKKEIRLVIQDSFPVPAVTGFRKPILILPQMMLLDGNRERLRHVMVHEMAHITRKDTLTVSLLNTLNAVYWFNPLVWICFKLIRADMETACDCTAIKTLGKVKRQGYIKTVLQFAGRNDLPRLKAAMGINSGSPKSRGFWGRSDGQRSMERRIRGMFLRTKTKGYVKLPVAILACILAFACFTTACQPVKDNSAPSMPTSVPEPLKFSESYSVAEHWAETVEEGKPKIVIDTDVYVPQVTEYPVVKVEQADFTQQRVDELVNYFARGKQLYLPHVYTKADYQRIIDNEYAEKARVEAEGEHITQNEFDDIIKTLENMQEAAPADSPLIKTDTTLTYDREYGTGKEITETGRNFLSVAFDNGQGGSASINVSNFVERQEEQDFTTYFYYSAGGSDYGLTESMYQNMTNSGETEEDIGGVGAGEMFGKVAVTPQEATAVADNVISNLGIKDMMLIGAEKYVTPDTPEKCGYEVQYARQCGGIAGYVPESYGWNNGEEPPKYSPPFYEEELYVRVSKDGLESLIWRNCAKAVETVYENTQLLPFESIKQALKDRITYKTRFNGGLGRVNYAVKVTSAELRMGYIDIKGNAKQALMVPVWFFRTRETWTRGGKTVLGNEETYKFSAIDGGAVEWR